MKLTSISQHGEPAYGIVENGQINIPDDSFRSRFVDLKAILAGHVVAEFAPVIPSVLNLETRLNGEIMQQAPISDLKFDVPYLNVLRPLSRKLRKRVSVSRFAA